MGRYKGGSVVAIFDSPMQAERAVDSLRSSGVAPEQILVARHNKAPTRGIGIDSGSNASSAAAIGAIFGATVGGVAAWVFSLSSVALPGQTPSSGIGTLAATLAGAGLGAAIGGLLGGMIGLRVPTETPELEEERALEAKVVVTVLTPMYSDPSRVESLLSAGGGQEVYAYSDISNVEDTRMDRDLSRVEPDYEVAPGYSGELSNNSGLPGIERAEPELDNWHTSLASSNDTDEAFAEPTLATVAADTEEEAVTGARADIDESTGEPNWYEAMPHLPVSAAPQVGSEAAHAAAHAEDAETWADLAAMEANSDMEDTTLNENPEGTNANNVTGTQGAVNPDTGAFGTGGTPMTTGYGVSGSTIGSGTVGGQDASESGDFHGSTPDSNSYESGGRGSTDSRKSLEGAERDAPVVDKYADQNIDAAGPQLQQDPRERDIYEKGPSYGEDTTAQPDSDSTDLYSAADVDAPPSYANTSIRRNTGERRH